MQPRDGHLPQRSPTGQFRLRTVHVVGGLVLVVGLLLATTSIVAVYVFGADRDRSWQADWPLAETTRPDMSSDESRWYATRDAFVHVGESAVISFDRETGKHAVKQRYPTTGRVCAAADRLADGHVILGTMVDDDCRALTAVDVRTGRTAWSKKLTHGDIAPEPDQALVIVDDLVIVLANNGVTALTTASGNQRWHTVPSKADCRPDDMLADAESVLVDAYCLSENASHQYLTSLDTKTGERRWQHHDTEHSESADERVVVRKSPPTLAIDTGADKKPTVLRFFTDRGAHRMDVTVPSGEDEVADETTHVGDAFIAAAPVENRVIGIDATTGKKRWEEELDRPRAVLGGDAREGLTLTDESPLGNIALVTVSADGDTEKRQLPNDAPSGIWAEYWSFGDTVLAVMEDPDPHDDEAWLTAFTP